jgi:cell division protein FtsL
MTQEPICSTPSCLTDRQVKEAVLTTKMNIIIFLSSIAVGLLGYSVYWQAPTLRAEMAKEINRLDDADHEQKVETDKLKDRVAALERREP